MKVSVEVKIKTKSGKEVTLDSNDAKELYEQLKMFFDKEKVYLDRWYSYPSRPYYPTYYPPYIWTSTSGNATLTSTKGDGTTPGWGAATGTATMRG